MAAHLRFDSSVKEKTLDSSEFAFTIARAKSEIPLRRHGAQSTLCPHSPETTVP